MPLGVGLPTGGILRPPGEATIEAGDSQTDSAHVKDDNAALELATLTWVDWFNHARLHSGLDYRTPQEVLKEWTDSQETA